MRGTMTDPDRHSDPRLRRRHLGHRPAHSDVSFTMRHMMVSKVRRHFEKFSGQIMTADDPLQSTVTAVVDATASTPATSTLTTTSAPPTSWRSTSTRPSSSVPPAYAWRVWGVRPG